MIFISIFEDYSIYSQYILVLLTLLKSQIKSLKEDKKHKINIKKEGK